LVPPASGAELEKVSLRLKWWHQFQFAGYYAAQSKGFYAQEGLEVEILEGGPTRPPLGAVLDGVTQFGITDSELVLARMQGKPVVVCAAIFQHSPYVLLSRADRGIRSPADLAGKTVMLSEGQGAVEMRATLKLEGIPPELVSYVPHSWDLADLIEGRVDAVSAYGMVEPYSLAARGVEPSILRTIDYGVDFYGDTLFTSDAEVKAHPERVRAFVRASRAGWEYAMRHPAEIADLILGKEGVAARGLTRELLLKQAEGMRAFILPDVVRIGHMNPGRWRRIADVFAGQGLAPANVPLDGFVFDPDARTESWLLKHWVVFAAGGLAAALLALGWTLQMRRLVRQRTLELRIENAERARVEVGLRQALGESQRFRSALDHVPACVFIKDRDLRYVYGNKSTVDTLGCATDKLLGRDDREFFSPETAREIQEWDRRALAGESFSRELDAGFAGGMRRFYQEVKAPIWVEEHGKSKIWGLLGISTDIGSQKEAEERFRALFQLAPTPLAMYSKAGVTTLVNDRFVELLGYSMEDVPTLDDWWVKAFPDPALREEKQAEWTQAVRDAVRTGGLARPVESRIRCKSGQTRVMEASARPMGDEILVTFFDLSQRREAEEALNREKEFTQSLLENLNAAVMACDERGSLTFHNRTAREWLGVDGEDSVRERLDGRHKLFLEDGETLVPPGMDPLSRALGGESVRGARLVVAADNQPPRHVLANASRLGGKVGENLGAVVVMLDVTKRHEAEVGLELKSAALNAAANAIVITDTKGSIQWANDAFTQLTGYTLQEVVGQNPKILRSGLQKPEFYKDLWETIGRGEVWHSELANRRKDGSIYHEEMTITPVRSSVGGITHYVAIKQDITERRSLEKQYLRAQRMEGVGMLAGGIAHDLNNVLAPILMSVELLRDAGLPPKLLPVVDTIERSSRRGADIVKQVLTFARGSEGERGPVQLRHLVKDMVRMTSETFPRDIRIESDMPANLWPVRGDATQLHQVLLNLSVNARDAMPKGGVLRFSASNLQLAADGVGSLAGLKPGAHVLLEVSDTGTGISPEHLEHMFEPFFTTKEVGKGTGLGLSTISGIVRGHAGAVDVRSELGKGTVFSVALPALPEQAAAVAEPASAKLEKGNGELILVVDDEVGIIAVTTAILKRAGYKVVSASNGEEGLEKFGQHMAEIALVVTDIMMPTMDGPTLIKHLRSRRPDIRCVASSGLMGDADRMRVEELKACGVRHFLTKPFTVEQLLRTVREELGS